MAVPITKLLVACVICALLFVSVAEAHNKNLMTKHRKHKAKAAPTIKTAEELFALTAIQGDKTERTKTLELYNTMKTVNPSNSNKMKVYMTRGPEGEHVKIYACYGDSFFTPAAVQPKPPAVADACFKIESHDSYEKDGSPRKRITVLRIMAAKTTKKTITDAANGDFPYIELGEKDYTMLDDVNIDGVQYNDNNNCATFALQVAKKIKGAKITDPALKLLKDTLTTSRDSMFNGDLTSGAEAKIDSLNT